MVLVSVHQPSPMRLLTLSLAALLSWGASAQWPTRPNAPLLLCDQMSTQTKLKAIPDDAGGWYALWLDDRNGGQEAIYGQHVDSDGQLLWEPEGREVQRFPNTRVRSYDAVILDNGHLFVAMTTGASASYGDTLRAMAYDSEAVPVWNEPVLLAHPGTFQGLGVISTMDDVRVITTPGAALISWLMNPFAADFITLSRIRNDGTRTIPVQGAFVTALNSTITSGPWSIRGDRAHGAIIERRFGNGAGAPLLAMRVDSNVTARWTTALTVSANSNGLFYGWTNALGDDALVRSVWEFSYDHRMAIYDTTGVLINGTSPIEVIVHPDIQENPCILPIGGGTYVNWADARTTFGGTRQVFMQRFDADGTPQLAANGVPVMLTNHEWNGFPKMAESDPGSVIHAMATSGTAVGTTFGLRAQRTEEDGTALWPDTVRFATPSFNPNDDRWHLFTDGDGGAVAFWKSGANARLYASRLDRNGLLASDVSISERSGFSAVLAYPNPTENVLCFDLSHDTRIISVECFDARGARTWLNTTARNADVSALTSGLYTARLLTSEGVRTSRFIKQ